MEENKWHIGKREDVPMDAEKLEVKKEESERKTGRRKRKKVKVKNQWRCEHGYLISRDGLYVCSKCREKENG